MLAQIRLESARMWIFMEGIVNIRLELNGEDAKRFNALKRKRGLKNNSELVRQVLKETEEREIPPVKEASAWLFADPQ